jgi:hypothetical protein
LTLVAVKPKTSDADYLDASYDLLRTNSPRSKTPVTLTGSYRFERVDPLFASVATPQGIRSDLLQHTAGLDANVGPVNARVAEIWSHDNLHDVPSILRTDTGVTSVNFMVPTGAFGQSQAAVVWWPVVSYALTRSSQAGEGMPANGGFVSPSQVPNQLNTAQIVGADWNFARLHVGYFVNHSFQDNRQPGRETSDFSNQAQQLALGVIPSPAFSVTLTLNREGATNLEADRASHTTRGGLIVNWQLDARNFVNATINRTAIRDAAAGSNDVADVNLQYSYAFRFQPSRSTSPTLRLFARWTWQSASALDPFAGVTTDRRNWTINTGVTLTLF